MVTVSLFILSIFGLGAFSFFNRDKSGKKDLAQQSKIALINGEPIDETRYYRQFNQFFASIPEDQRILLDPDIIDYYKYESLQKTISYMLMISEANKQGIKVLPQEVKYRTEQIAKLYKLKGVKELKKLLKERNIDWKVFKNQQKEEVLIAKFMNGITSRVKVTPLDKKMVFTEIKTRHILIKVNTDNINEDLKALKKAESIYEMVLANRKRFADIARQYSEDKLTAKDGGDLGWVSRGQMVPAFEKQLYKLTAGDIAGPIKTLFGYHIILAEDRKDRKIPEGVTEKEIENQILQEKQQEALKKWLEPLQKNADIQITDPALKAYEYRVNNEFLRAAIEYQKSLSGQQNNLLLYIQIARMMEKQDRMDEALKIFQKAIIWQKYNPQYQYPILYFAFTDFYLKTDNKKDAKKIIDQVIKLFGQNKTILAAVLSNYQNILTMKEISDIEIKIADIEIAEQRAEIEGSSPLGILQNK